MANSVSNIKIEPADLNWGNQETTLITFVDDVAGSLNSTFYEFDMPAFGGTAAQLFYLWFDINSAGADPTPAGRTGVTVAGATGATAVTLVAAAVVALDGSAANVNSKVDFDSTSKLRMKNTHVGSVTATADGSAATSFTFVQELDGSSLDLGFIDGATEISLSEDLFDVVAQQTGTNVEERIRTGKNIEAISVAMKESDAAKLVTILEAGGASVTPAGGTAVSGHGNSQDFSNIVEDSRKLTFHPVALTDVTDHTRDWAFWRAYPNLSGLNFSGDSDQLVTVEFSILPDPIITQSVRLFVYKDHTQNLLR